MGDQQDYFYFTSLNIHSYELVTLQKEEMYLEKQDIIFLMGYIR